MKNTLLFLFLAVSLSATAQFRAFRDVVYLNDGSVIKGKIRFAEPDSTLFVDTQYGCTFTYTKDKVNHFELEWKKPFTREKGPVLRSSISGGLLACFDDKVSPTLSADLSMDLFYRIGCWYEIGLDCNYILFYPDYSMNSLAVQLAQRCYFSRKPISPYLDLKIGVSGGRQNNLPESYESYYWYGDYYRMGVVNRGFMGELGVGLAVRNFDFALCAALSPYMREGFCYSSLYDTYFCSQTNYYTFSLRIGYSFPL